MATNFGFLWIVLSCLTQIANTFNCPDVKYVELGEDVVIDCRISQLGDVYWYKGTSTEISPIVQLEGGRKQVIHGDGHYDIKDDGSLIVKDLEEQYYGFYGVVNFHPDDTFDKGQIKIEVAVKPETPCPIIADCSTCYSCTLAGVEVGNVTCGIDKTHPQVHLNILVDSENDGFNVLNNVSTTTYDSVTETWNTKMTIGYEWFACDSSLRVRCVTTNDHPFEISDSFAYIKTGPCPTTVKPLRQDSLNAVTIVFITGAVFLAVLLGLTILIWQLRASNQNRGEYGREEEKELQPLMDEHTVKSFVDKLATTYEEFGFPESFPNQQSIKSDELLIGVRFLLTDLKSGIETNISSPTLLDFFVKTKKAILIVEEDFRQKIFLPYLYSFVCNISKEQDIIFILDMTGFHDKMHIAEALVKKLKLDGFTCDVVENILRTQPCIILVTGIDELLLKHGNSDETMDSNMEGFTIDKLFKDPYFFTRCDRVRYMVVAGRTINWRKVISNDYILAEVINFFPQNLNEYVSDVFDYYYQSPANAFDVSNTSSIENNKREKRGHEKEASFLTKLVFDECNMVKDLELSQSLMIILIHILISDLYMERTDFSEECICKLLYQTKTILNCLEFPHSKDTGCEKTVETLEMVLGNIATAEREESASQNKLFLPSQYSKSQITDKVSCNDLEKALTGGILRRYYDTSKDGDVDVYMFSHPILQEYLAALALLSDKPRLELFLNSSSWREEERMKTVFQFMFVMSSRELRNRLLKLLLENKEWNMLIDCVFELDDSDRLSNVKMTSAQLGAGMLFPGQTLKIKHLDNHYHRLAVSTFFKALVFNKVCLQELSFENYWSREWFKQLEMPQVKSLVFTEIDLTNESDHKSVLQFASKHDIKTEALRFDNCQLPESLESHQRKIEGTVPQTTEARTPANSKT